jgi:hypothetical protein
MKLTAAILALAAAALFGAGQAYPSHASIRALTSENAVPALRTYGRLLLADATRTGRDGAARHPAMVNYNGDPFALRVRETRGGETRTMPREGGGTIPYSGSQP